MRVICTAVPGSGLFLASVPLAWALRAAGHEVLLLNNGPGARAASQAGLPVVDPVADRDLWAEFMAAIPKNRMAPPTPAQGQAMGGRFGWFGEQMVDGMLEVGRAFRPDMVISTTEQGAGPLLAAALGVPLVEHSIRIASAGNDEHSTMFRDGVAAYLAPKRAQLGIGDVPARVATLDMRPPSLGGTATDAQWLMRYVPYNESRVVPAWVTQPAQRPRVCVTLGTVVPAMGGLDVLRGLVADLSTMDADVLLAVGDIDLTELGELPANVRPLGWMPLTSLMPTCAAILHHAGSATVATPLVHGVPQVALPRGADQPRNAELVARSGVGIVIDEPDQAADALHKVLGDPGFAERAAVVRDEIAAQPSPAEIVSRLVELVH